MLIISKSFENILQAVSGVTFGKSPNGTPFAERERERERERDEQRLDIICARARLSRYFSKLLYSRYIVSYDIAAFYFVFTSKTLQSWQSREEMW
ncbi:MAG: hypothetical protein LBL04_14140 [Bacteroidales bacterium]|nr:hypothetical protein [Bacteroidales bacterium]